MALKARPWINYLTRQLWWTANPRRVPQPLNQTSLVLKQNERLPSSVLRMMQQERLAGRHIPRVALQSSFGTLTRSKKSLGYIHTRSGMQGACSTYTFKSCERRGFNWVSTCIDSRAWIPSLRPPRQCIPALEASVFTIGYPHFHNRSSRLLHRLPSVTLRQFSLSGVRPPVLPRRPRRVFPRAINRPGTPLQRQPPRSPQRSPTETHARPCLPTFPSPVQVRPDPPSRDLRACPTYSPSARVGAGSRVRCERKRWARLVRMGTLSSPPFLHPRRSV